MYRGHLETGALFPTTILPHGARGRNQGPRQTFPALHCRSREQIIVVTLGTTRVNRKITAVKLTQCSSDPGSSVDFSSFLAVTAPGSEGPQHDIPLPLLEDHIHDPMIFIIPEDTDPKLAFRVYRTGLLNSPDGQIELGKGMALLDNHAHIFDSGRQGLLREYVAAIFDPLTMDSLGEVTFTCMVVKPFPHLQTLKSTNFTRSKGDKPLLIGHRGNVVFGGRSNGLDI